MLVLRRTKAYGWRYINLKHFDDICKENNVSIVEQALGCEELWNLNNGISVCYRCHKDIEKLRTKLRNMFILRNVEKINKQTTEP
jgi:hypothetical protein